MGKSVVSNENVASYLSNLAKTPVHHTGLLIGTSTPQRDVIVHIIPTPKKDTPDDEVVTKDKEQDGRDKKKKKKSQSSVSSKDEPIDEAWICQHAKQVNRMLPGGFDVLGLFVYAPTETYAKMLPTVRQVMFSAFKTLKKDQQIGLCGDDSERIQLHVCSVTQKVTCRTLDIADYKSTVKPAEWSSSGALSWSQLDTDFRVDQWIPVSQDQSKQGLLHQIQNGLDSLFTSVLNATLLFNNQLRPKEETLQTPAEGSGKKGKQTAKQTPKELKKFKVDLFLHLAENNNISGVQITDCGASMDVCGTIHCRAFVHSKAIVEEAIRAVQQDIIRSLTARCEIQCEEMLLIDEEQQDPSLVHELPRRVFANLPGQDISVSDYIYRADSAMDSLDAFQELLNLQLNQDDIDTSCEQSPAYHDLNEQDMEERLSEAGEQVMEAINSRRNIILPLASAAVIAVATGVSYFLLQDNI